MEGEHGIGRFGGSLRVESVQALAARRRWETPARYIRPERKGEEVVAGDGSERIPVIDLGKLVHPDFSKEEAAKLHLACADWGFFQISNHGVSEDIINKVKKDIKAFFMLPQEEKEKVAQLPGEIEGYGNAFVHSEEQKLDWGDMLYLTALPAHLRMMNLWPPIHPHSGKFASPLISTYDIIASDNKIKPFRTTIDNYSTELKRIASLLLHFFSKNIGLKRDNLSDSFMDGFQTMRINYYPPCPNPEKVLGISPHSDGIGLTILLQANEVQGLQIRRGGRWLTVDVHCSQFVVNIGDIIEIMTNGKYKSIEHRAIVSSEEERLSIATFFSLNFGDSVGPLAELLEREEPLYTTLEYQNYMTSYLAGRLDGKCHIDLLKLV